MVDILANVQPMSDDSGAIFSIEPPASSPPDRDRFSNMRHCFIGGWEVYDGRNWLPLDEFYTKYPDLNYEEFSNLPGNWRLYHWSPYKLTM